MWAVVDYESAEIYQKEREREREFPPKGCSAVANAAKMYLKTIIGSRPIIWNFILPNSFIYIVKYACQSENKKNGLSLR